MNTHTHTNTPPTASSVAPFAWSAAGAGLPFERQPLDLGPLADDDLEVQVAHCGLCSADLSMWRNDWGITRYPFIAGHEVVGTVTRVGARVDPARLGQTVGVGWLNGSCMHCWQCLGGAQHLCPSRRRTLFAQPGGFASHMRSHWAWAIPLPAGLEASTAGPLFCAGITVFRPLLDLPVLPTWRVGVVGLGGLGHLAVEFLAAWGCEVIVITSHADKTEEAQRLGATTVVHSAAEATETLAGALDLLVVTSANGLDWPKLMRTLAARGRVHVLATLSDDVPVSSSLLTGGDRSVAGSSTGSPLAAKQMLDFCARHHLQPQVQRYPMHQINEAMRDFAAGQARFRIVLDAEPVDA